MDLARDSFSNWTQLSAPAPDPYRSGKWIQLSNPDPDPDPADPSVALAVYTQKRDGDQAHATKI